MTEEEYRKHTCERVWATMSITIRCNCPHCGKYIDVEPSDDGISEDAVWYDALNGDRFGYDYSFDEKLSYPYDRECPECGKTFCVEAVEW
jgi:endogenous inhibitor of DNA gyrase (YacG/DUF329 family)